ncbi:MAG: permease, partial [Planctomycetes bacterium]|nr:permease [Planctomycetota bacterium]
MRPSVVLDLLRNIVVEFWAVFAEMSPYLLFGFFVAGVMAMFVSRKMVERHLGGPGVTPLLKASIFGVPLPLCSCGVIPVAMSLRKHGAGRGATIAFLLSTPQTGVDSIVVTYSLLGPVFAIFRPIAAFVTGLAGGML